MPESRPSTTTRATAPGQAGTGGDTPRPAAASRPAATKVPAVAAAKAPAATKAPAVAAARRPVAKVPAVAAARRPVAKRPRKPRPIAFVRCGGGSPACEGGPVCGQGCIGCGACVEACKFGAISLNGRGVAFVDRERCRGCSVCTRKCPKGIIELVDPDRAIRVRCATTSVPKLSREKCSVSCISCGICVRACPADAISLENRHARIDYDLCIVCGMCAAKCPRGAISDAFGMFAAE